MQAVKVRVLSWAPIVNDFSSGGGPRVSTSVAQGVSRVHRVVIGHFLLFMLGKLRPHRTPRPDSRTAARPLQRLGSCGPAGDSRDIVSRREFRANASRPRSNELWACFFSRHARLGGRGRFGGPPANMRPAIGARATCTDLESSLRGALATKQSTGTQGPDALMDCFGSRSRMTSLVPPKRNML